MRTKPRSQVSPHGVYGNLLPRDLEIPKPLIPYYPRDPGRRQRLIAAIRQINEWRREDEAAGVGHTGGHPK
jgi:hypothetical protein